MRFACCLSMRLHSRLRARCLGDRSLTPANARPQNAPAGVRQSTRHHKVAGSTLRSWWISVSAATMMHATPSTLVRVLWGVRPRIPMVGHMGYAPRGSPAHKKEPCRARFCSATPARHGEDILKMLRDLIGYVRSHISCNLLLLFGYLSDLTDL